MNISVCIPSFRRYDCLKKLFISGEKGTIVPKKYVIYDNGGKFNINDYPEVKDKVEVIYTGTNQGISTAWNTLVKATTDIRVICNDDIEFSENTLQTFVEQWDENQLCYPGWAEKANMFSCFSVSDYLFNLVDGFDEEFFPAYFEDNSFAYKIVLKAREGYSVGFKPLSTTYNHVGSATLKSYSSTERSLHDVRFKRNEQLYKLMWGGSPDHETFSEKWNGDETYKQECLKNLGK